MFREVWKFPVTSTNIEVAQLPAEFNLYQNHSNPFDPRATIIIFLK